MPLSPQTLTGLSEIAPRYRGVICDVWGVVHNGRRLYPGAAQALGELRRSIGPVVLLSNAPKSARSIAARLTQMGLDEAAYDRILTSGSMVRDVLRRHEGPVRVLFVGTDDDRDLLRDVDVDLTDDPARAEVFLVCGFTPAIGPSAADYGDLLGGAAAHGLVMICANPDRWAPSGDRLAPCAGLLADAYEAQGGAVRRYGKPFPEAFGAALTALETAVGRPIAKPHVLVIGDGMETDIAGAARMGMDSVLIESGLHAVDFGADAAGDGEARWARHGARPTYTMDHLCWTPA